MKQNPKTPTIKSSNKPTKQPTENSPAVNAGDVSLETLGAHMLFGSVDEHSMQSLNEFIIKSNYVLQTTQPITIFINSSGGDVYSGFGTIDLMECSHIKIKTVAIGMVASMAALIFTSGTPGMRVMSKNSFIMTHQFSWGFEGKYHEMVVQSGHIDDLQQRFIQHFLRHTKLSEARVKDILLKHSDTYIGAKEALKFGLCDKIQNPWS